MTDMKKGSHTGIRVGAVKKSVEYGRTHHPVVHEPHADVTEIFRQNGLKFLDDPNKTGGWGKQMNHVGCSMDLLAYYFPQMDRETQERAGRSMLNLTETWGLDETT